MIHRCQFLCLLLLLSPLLDLALSSPYNYVAHDPIDQSSDASFATPDHHSSLRIRSLQNSDENQEEEEEENTKKDQARKDWRNKRKQWNAYRKNCPNNGDNDCLNYETFMGLDEEDVVTKVKNSETQPVEQSQLRAWKNHRRNCKQEDDGCQDKDTFMGREEKKKEDGKVFQVIGAEGLDEPKKLRDWKKYRRNCKQEEGGCQEKDTFMGKEEKTEENDNIFQMIEAEGPGEPKKLRDWKKYRRNCKDEDGGCQDKNTFMGKEEETKKDNNIFQVNKREDEPDISYTTTVYKKQTEARSLHRYITSVGTTAVATHSGDRTTVPIPEGTISGDVIVMFVGGNTNDRSSTSDPYGSGWTKIIESGSNEINLKAFYKQYGPGEPKEYSVDEGENTYIILTTLRGLDLAEPIVDSDISKNSMDKSGDQLAPTIFAEDYGCIIGVFFYADTNAISILNKYFRMASSFSSGGFSMAASIAPTGQGNHEPIEAIPLIEREKRVQDITLAISFRRA